MRDKIRNLFKIRVDQFTKKAIKIKQMTFKRIKQKNLLEDEFIAITFHQKRHLKSKETQRFKDKIDNFKESIKPKTQQRKGENIQTLQKK